jgi:hypothetical protein
MKITRAFVLCLAILALFWVLPTQAANKSEIIAVTMFDPLGGFLGLGSIGSWPDFGTTTCPGHQPLPPPAFPICPAGSRSTQRGIVLEGPISSSDPRLDGTEIFDLNSNFDANAEGPYWGKWRIELKDGGVWEGNYNGKLTYSGGIIWIGLEEGVLHGSGGSIDGMLLKISGRITTFFYGLAFYGNITGYILDSHDK